MMQHSGGATAARRAAIGRADGGRDRTSRETPIELLAPLFVLILAFGLFLTAAVPFGYVSQAVAELHRGEIFTTLWFVMLAALTFFVLLRWCTIQVMAFVAHCRQECDRPQTPTDWPLVSILVPAYQESTTITSALQSLIALDYPRYEIIVVDDGSSDDTHVQASRFVGRHARCTLTLLRKENGGKWSALNLAFRHARADVVLCIDADSRLSPDALKHLVRRLDGREIAGVSGQITVRNRRSLITRLQAYEYVVANGGLRTAQSLFGMVLVVPGPIGLYRRSALQRVVETEAHLVRTNAHPGSVSGPFSPETFAEDFQLSLTILALGGRIVYEPRALSFTKSPDLTQTLLNQRYRWFRGTLQVLRIYMRRLHGPVGSRKRRLSLVIAAIYLLDLFVLPPLNLGIVIGAAVLLTTSPAPIDMLLWVSAIWLLNLLTATYHILSQREDLSLLLLAPLYDLYHSLLLNSAWAIAMVDEARQSEMSW